MCSFIIGFRKVHTSVLWYWLNTEEYPCMVVVVGGRGGKAPFILPHSQYIYCKYIIEESGEIHSLKAFYKLFLSDIKVKILITFQMFLYQQKLSFYAASGWFFGQNSQNVVNFVWNLDQWWHARWCIRYASIFIEVSRNGQNWLIFLVICKPSYTWWVTPQDFANGRRY